MNLSGLEVEVAVRNGRIHNDGVHFAVFQLGEARGDLFIRGDRRIDGTGADIVRHQDIRGGFLLHGDCEIFEIEETRDLPA